MFFNIATGGKLLPSPVYLTKKEGASIITTGFDCPGNYEIRHVHGAGISPISVPQN